MDNKPVTDKQIKEARPADKRRRISCGESLYIMIEPISKAANSKSFVGNIRFPRGRKGKQIEVRIGAFGEGNNRYNLKKAKDEWDRLKRLSKKLNKDPRDIQKEERECSFKIKISPSETIDVFKKNTKYSDKRNELINNREKKNDNLNSIVSNDDDYIIITRKDLVTERYQLFDYKSNKFLISRDNEKYYLISRTCPHQGGLIINKGKKLVCPLHNWNFSPTGECFNSTQNALSVELKIKNSHLIISKQKLKLLGLKEEFEKTKKIEKENIQKIKDLPILKLHSHASLELDFNKLNILFDPWLDGPAMLGSWRQYPKPLVSGSNLDPDIIVITHEHSDHFHLPTLKALGKDKLIIFPDFKNNRIKSFLDSNGFFNYNCIEFNKKIKLAPEMFITFFRPKSLFNDSIVLLEKNLFRFLNLNDAGLNPEIASKVGPVHLISSIFSTGASGYPLTWTHLNNKEKYELMKNACFGRLQMLEQALMMYESDYIIPFASHVKLWLEEHDKYRKRLISNTINEVTQYFKEKGKSDKLIDIIPGDEYSLKDLKHIKAFYNRKLIYKKEEVDSLIIKDRDSYKGDLISWDRCNINIDRNLIIDHFTKELSSKDIEVEEDLYLICEIYGNLSERFIFRFTNGSFIYKDSIEPGIPILKMRIKDKILINIISGYLSWDEAKVGYWIKWWRNTKKVHNSLTRAMQSPKLPLDRSHHWRFKDRQTKIDLSISELIRQNKKVDTLLKTYGLFCNGCSLSPWETVEDAARAHGLSESSKKDLFKDIYELINY